VYYFSHISHLDKFNDNDYLDYIDKNATIGKKYFVLVDEVQAKMQSGALNKLIKDIQNIKTIACGVPMINVDTSIFSQKFEPKDLLFKKAELNNDDLIKYNKDLLMKNATLTDENASDIVKHVMESILEFTGGHTYPFLKLCEISFSKYYSKCVDKSILDYIRSAEFLDTEDFKSICTRCYNNLKNDVEIRAAAINIIQNGIDYYRNYLEFLMLDKVGLLNPESTKLLSPFITNSIFHWVKPSELDYYIPGDIDIVTSENDPNYETELNKRKKAVEKIIILGLLELKESQLNMCNIDSTKIDISKHEDSISIAFGLGIKENVKMPVFGFSVNLIITITKFLRKMKN
jgi:hypothetical protein